MNNNQKQYNMATITIKNVGPIKSVENLELNKVNVFMGPQCSGKSTIAKIISFCTWMEKKLAREGEVNTNHDEFWYFEKLQTYHRLTNDFFSDDSYIYYDGQNISYLYERLKSKFQYIESRAKIEHKQENKFFNSKIIYIPAERNFVSVVPNLEKYLEKRDSIHDFIISWFEAKRTYGDKNKLPILNFGIQYHTDSFDNDFITHDTGVKLKLQSASSGLQSVVPLLVLLDYVAIGLYGKSRPMSVQERDTLIGKYNEMVQRKKEADESIDSVDLEVLLDLIVSKNYTNSQFIVEEPEQNLFPSTQRDLVYHLLRLITGERDHRLTITTHSPYILYALNNCMMAGLVYDKMDEEDKDAIVCKYSLINPKDVSIYQIEDGILKNIQQEDGLIGKNYFDEKMKELMDDFYILLKYYDDEK